MYTQSELRTAFKETFRLSLPLIVGQLGQVMVSVSDNIMVGQLGTVELAAVSLGVAVFAFFFVIGFGLSFALPPLIAESYMKRNEGRMRRSLWNSLLVNLAYSVLVVIITELSLPLLYHIGQAAEVVDNAIPYLRLSVYSIAPFMVFQAFRSLSDGMGQTLISMKAMLVGNVLNVALNYVLIFGVWGAPRLGIEGAGWSSLIARVVMLLVWLVLIWQKPDIKKLVRHLHLGLYSAKFIRKILSLGSVTSLQMLFEVSLFSGSTIMMGMIGEVPQAAHQVALNLITVSFMVTTGFSLAATIRVGQLSVNEDRHTVLLAGYMPMGMSMVFMTLSALTILLLRFSLPHLYIHDSEVVELAALLLVFAALFQISDGLQVTALGALRGLQDVKVPAIFTFIAYMLIGMPVAYVAAFPLGLNASGVWLGLLSGLTISALLNSLRFRYLLKVKEY